MRPPEDCRSAVPELLAASGVDAPRLAARVLAEHAVGDDALLWRLALRRAGGEPLSRILGVREFWSLDFEIGPAVFDPRPDSETVVEAALAACPEPRTVLDLGVGSGCLLAAVLTERPGARGLGVDVSDAAVRIAARNLRDLPARLVVGDWMSCVRGPFDLIVSNPPYVADGDIAGLAPEVRDHDPRGALDGGPDGLAAYRVILTGLPRLLAAGSFAVLEIGCGQEDAVTGLAGAAGLNVVATRRDLGGIPRAMTLAKRL